jgi:DivIVA domain-containing protein
VIWVLFIVVLVLVVGGFAALVTARVGYDPLSEPTMTQSDPGLEEDFAARDIASVRFDTALRGYRMDQVDAVLDRLQERIARLEGSDGPTTSAPAAIGAPAATRYPETPPTPENPEDPETSETPVTPASQAQPRVGGPGGAAS